MPDNNPAPSPETGSPAAGSSGQEDRNQRYWFHILAQNTPAARNLHAAKLVDKAWQQGDRVCVVCDTMQHAEELDDLLWNFSPDAFIPIALFPILRQPARIPSASCSARPLRGIGIQ